MGWGERIYVGVYIVCMLCVHKYGYRFNALLPKSVDNKQHKTHLHYLEECIILTPSINYFCIESKTKISGLRMLMQILYDNC